MPRALLLGVIFVLAACGPGGGVDATPTLTTGPVAGSATTTLPPTAAPTEEPTAEPIDEPTDEPTEPLAPTSAPTPTPTLEFDPDPGTFEPLHCTASDQVPAVDTSAVRDWIAEAWPTSVGCVSVSWELKPNHLAIAQCPGPIREDYQVFPPDAVVFGLPVDLAQYAVAGGYSPPNDSVWWRPVLHVEQNGLFYSFAFEWYRNQFYVTYQPGFDRFATIKDTNILDGSGQQTGGWIGPYLMDFNPAPVLLTVEYRFYWPAHDLHDAGAASVVIASPC